MFGAPLRLHSRVLYTVYPVAKCMSIRERTRNWACVFNSDYSKQTLRPKRMSGLCCWAGCLHNLLSASENVNEWTIWDAGIFVSVNVLMCVYVTYVCKPS